MPPPGPHSPIEREIERSERASAALAAARVLARAAFTDSQLAAEDAAGDFDNSGWVRTEYAALDHPVRGPQDDAKQDAAPRNLVGGSFNPGIASQHGRAFPGASIAHAPIRTRTGAQARFLQEARQTPRSDRLAGTGAKSEHAPLAGAANYDKPAVIPMLAPALAPPRVARPAAASRAHGPAREPFRFALAAGVGAAIVLVGGGIAMKAGLLSRGSATDAGIVTARVAAQAEAARVLSVPPQQITITPAAGVAPARTDAEVNAALAAAARAAAVPVATVHAAAPSRIARPLPAVAATPAAAPAPALDSPSSQRSPAHGKDSVAAAIASAQARADNFLASGSGAAAAPASDAKPEQ